MRGHMPAEPTPHGGVRLTAEGLQALGAEVEAIQVGGAAAHKAKTGKGMAVLGKPKTNQGLACPAPSLPGKPANMPDRRSVQ